MENHDHYQNLGDLPHLAGQFEDEDYFQGEVGQGEVWVGDEVGLVENDEDEDAQEELFEVDGLLFMVLLPAVLFEEQDVLIEIFLFGEGFVYQLPEGCLLHISKIIKVIDYLCLQLHHLYSLRFVSEVLSFYGGMCVWYGNGLMDIIKSI